MGQVTVAEDVLDAQPSPVRELDVDLLVEHDIEKWVIDHWLDDVRFLVAPGRGAASGTLASNGPEERQLDDVATAVRAAADRFWLVEESGRELPGTWAVPDSRTPDVVLGPLRSDAGIVVAAGTKDGVTVPMAEALLNILREELDRVDVDTHIACLPREIAVNDLRPWHDPPPPETAAETTGQTEQMCWYVMRWVTETTASGFRREDAYYLRPDMEWTQDPGEGVSFAEEDRDSVARLLTKVRAVEGDEVNAVNALLLPATDGAPRPMRPEDVRERH